MPPPRDLLGFAGLHALLRPVADRLDALIDYHLRKVFTKLSLTSRTDLVRLGVPA